MDMCIRICTVVVSDSDQSMCAWSWNYYLPLKRIGSVLWIMSSRTTCIQDLMCHGSNIYELIHTVLGLWSSYYCALVKDVSIRLLHIFMLALSLIAMLFFACFNPIISTVQFLLTSTCLVLTHLISCTGVEHLYLHAFILSGFATTYGILLFSLCVHMLLWCNMWSFIWISLSVCIYLCVFIPLMSPSLWVCAPLVFMYTSAYFFSAAYMTMTIYICSMCSLSSCFG